MATFLNELAGSGLKCRDESGKIVPCPRPSSFGCAGGGCSLGADKLVPFDLPIIGGVEQFDLTDAVMGALAGKAVTGVLTSVVEGIKGEKWANYTKLGVGGLAIGGLAIDSLRSSPAFLGFSFATWPEMAEPVTDWVANKVLWIIEKVTGKTFAPVGATGLIPGGSGSANTLTVSGIRGTRRIGQERGAPQYRPQIKSPSELISQGTRMGATRRTGTAGLMGGSAFRRPIVNSLRS